MGASSPLVRFTLLTNAFFRCPSPDDATVIVIWRGSTPSSSTRARLASAEPGPGGGGDLRTDMVRCWGRGKTEWVGEISGLGRIPEARANESDQTCGWSWMG